MSLDKVKRKETRAIRIKAAAAPLEKCKKYLILQI